MSRIGKKPITLPQGVKVQVQGNVVTVQGPKGKVDNHVPAGVKVEQKDGHIHVVREDDSKGAAHGLVRALGDNAVEGASKARPKKPEDVGLGYPAHLNG